MAELIWQRWWENIPDRREHVGSKGIEVWSDPSCVVSYNSLSVTWWKAMKSETEADNAWGEGRNWGRPFQTLVCHARGQGVFLGGSGKSLKGVMWESYMGRFWLMFRRRSWERPRDLVSNWNEWRRICALGVLYVFLQRCTCWDRISL